MQHIFRVGELTRALKDVIEGQFPFVWVRGQVSNLARPASGHVYFSLGDAEAVLPVVWFKGSQSGISLNESESYDPLTGEVLPGKGGSAWLSDGADVLCAGRLTVYEPRGAYQLVAEMVQDMGLGRLFLEFEALKKDLAARGWFDPGRKRPLPVNPRRVAVVTAPSGAAIRDFLRVGSTRGAGCEIRIHPSLVQGEAAPGQIVKALDAAGADGWAQVVVLIRGGGSIEDLWAFNTEEVAGAVVRCPIPVVCGVGHEVDTTIADMAADVRAATPSHAAQLLWPERATLAQRLDETDMRLEQAFDRFLRGRTEKLDVLSKALSWLSPAVRVERARERLDGLSGRLLRTGRELGERPARVLDGLTQRLGRSGRMLPEGPAARVEELAGRMDRAGLTMLDGTGLRLDTLERRLNFVREHAVERGEALLSLLAARLEGLDPRRPLERGYALARKADGTFLRTVDDASPGEPVEILVSDGVVRTVVTGAERSGE